MASGSLLRGADFLDAVKTASECQSRLAELRALSSLPTVLYGSGIYAREVRNFLDSLDVPVAGCFVDDRYAGQSRVAGILPSSFSEIDAAYPEYNAVVAFCQDPYGAAARLEAKNSKKIRSIRIIDCRFWERFRMMTPEWIQAQRQNLSALYGWLGDELSKKVFAAFLNAKLTFDPSPLRSLATFPQYFPDDLPAFKPKPEDVFIDAGAYNGDTLLQVVSIAGGKGLSAYHAFEPDPKNLARLNDAVQENKWGFVHVFPVGLWDKPERVRFEDYHDSRSYVTEKGQVEVEVTTLDEFGLAPTFIKMDIEGSEWEALQGAANTIASHAPRMAVAAYHNPEDLVRIPQFLKKLCPGYTFYLRIHSSFSEELVLYADIGRHPRL